MTSPWAACRWLHPAAPESGSRGDHQAGPEPRGSWGRAGEPPHLTGAQPSQGGKRRAQGHQADGDRAGPVPGGDVGARMSQGRRTWSRAVLVPECRYPKPHVGSVPGNRPCTCPRQLPGGGTCHSDGGWSHGGGWARGTRDPVCGACHPRTLSPRLVLQVRVTPAGVTAMHPGRGPSRCHRSLSFFVYI